MRRKQDSSKLKLIEQLRQVPIVQVACSRVGVPRANYYRWRKEDAQFQTDCDGALKDGIGLINDLAESKVMAGINEGKPVFVMAWLNNRHPAYSRQRSLSVYEATEEYRLALEETRKRIKEFLDEDDDLIESSKK